MTDDGDGHALYYTDDLVVNLQLRWGDGFLSPGGAEELARMLRGIDLSGMRGLDFGCGIGGYDMALVAEHGAAHVTGIDIDAAKLADARARAARAGLTAQLDYVEVAPGPLAQKDGAFDFAFSKDSIIELPEKAEIFGELYRVLRPGGLLIVSDWFCADAPYTPEMRDWATTGDETYQMDTLTSAAAMIAAAGFADIETDDRNDWFRAYSRDEYERLKGPLFETYVARFGAAQAHRSVENARIRNLLAEQGQLRPGHIRARRG